MRFFLIIIIFIYSKGYSQDLIVRYSCNQGYSVGNLIIFEDNSLWQIQASDKEGTEETLIIQTNSTDEYYLVKSYKDNLMYIGDNFNFFQKMYYYKDSLYQMKWKITKNTKNILGKKCSEAKLSFRGRNYTAYYSQDFGVSEGPWKFFGLPGLILEVKSDDGEYTWIAIEIKKNPKEKLKNISYTNAKYTSRQEFIKDYISNFNKMIAKQKATGRNGFLKIQNEEIFYPEAQKEFGIGY